MLCMGLFITIEGPEGSGKTTVAKEITDYLQQQGYPVLYTREPGGVEIAEKIRDIILDVNHTTLDARCEALLYAASRRQHLVEKIEPALKEGKIIICDRFIDSSLAYQGYARGIGIEEVYSINLFAIHEQMPDLTILLDLDPQEGLKRIKETRFKELNRLDLEALTFHQKVYDGYKILKQKYASRFSIVNANQTKQQVFHDVLNIILQKCEEKKICKK